MLLYHFETEIFITRDKTWNTYFGDFSKELSMKRKRDSFFVMNQSVLFPFDFRHWNIIEKTLFMIKFQPWKLLKGHKTLNNASLEHFAIKFNFHTLFLPFMNKKLNFTSHITNPYSLQRILNVRSSAKFFYILNAFLSYYEQTLYTNTFREYIKMQKK